MTKADRVRRLAHDLAVHAGEFERLPRAVGEVPNLWAYLAEAVTEDEIRRARIAGFPPAWLEEAKRT